MRPLLFITACVLAYLPCSCSRPTDSADGQNINSSMPQSTATQPSGDNQDDSIPISDLPGASLSQGTLIVFGLSLPKGMLPLEGPKDVYRFEGSHPAEMIFKSVESQVSSPRMGKEGDGFLVREAQVRNPKGNATGEEKIALRIRKRNGGGNITDIWLEPSYVKKIDRVKQSNMASFAIDKPKATRAPTNWNRNTKESRRQTLSVQRKVSRGQKLTKEELSSSAFH